MRLFRAVLGTLSAAAVAIAGLAASAAPARANDDLVRFLAGAAAIGIITHALSERDRNRKQGNARRPRAPRPVAGLPQQCTVEMRERRRGAQIFYDSHCLQQSGIRTANLPNWCQATLRTNRGNRAMYDANCMRQAGYQIARSGRHRHPF